MALATRKHTYNHGTATFYGFDMEVHECGTCGVVFAMALGFTRARRDDHASWYCPNGHSWSFSSESDEERLRRERNEARDSAARLQSSLDQTEASRRAYKGQVTRVRKRIANGICPCCHRTFTDLAQHMEAKHPDYAEPPA